MKPTSLQFVPPILFKDFYKVGHPFQYPKETTKVYSNLTARGTRRSLPHPEGVIAFGFQYFVAEYLIRQFNENFFRLPKDEVVNYYERRIKNALGPGTTVNHIADLHDVGYLPLHIKAVPEGTLVPYRVPVLTLHNTMPRFYWLTNMVETLLSDVLWLPMTSATTAFQYRRVFEQFAELTGADPAFIPWQGHDFSMRGMEGVEGAALSGAGHLLSFTGTDTIPAIDLLEIYYGADSDRELVGGSVPATEHSVMCMGLKKGEFALIERLVTQVYPKDIVSIVFDTFDFWEGVNDYLLRLRDVINAREGKVVIRPDSGDPVKIICGDPEAGSSHERAGAIQRLWDIFGGTINDKGYKVLNPHIGLIYGDSITLDRQREILQRLRAKGFASSNVVLGIGSYTYQYVTRDTDGWAMKATYAERTTPNGSIIEGVPIFKAPKTDNGLKNSAKGLLAVFRDGDVGTYAPNEPIYLKEEVDWHQEGRGILQTIFKNGVAHNIQTLGLIRRQVESQL